MHSFHGIRLKINAFGAILLGFAGIILIGAALLCLGISTRDGSPVPFINALFTSVSATCVTGLVVYDTATQWSLFGRTVILILIQIGGFGVVTLSVIRMFAMRKQIGIFQRLAMQEAISFPHLGGIVRFTRFFLMVTLVMEGAGVLLLLPRFASDFGLLKGLGMAVFHSVSAFCNAGFDLMGEGHPFSSLMHYAGDVRVNTVIILLIVIGGIGYSTWRDLLDNRFRPRKLRLQSKIILVTTAFLIGIPFLFFLFVEFSSLPFKERVLASLFAAVTPRTAGFNTMPTDQMSEPALLITIILMIIGGAPGSTAGGIKVTTLFVLLAAAKKNLRREGEVSVFHRRIEPDVISNAFTLLMVYLSLLLFGTILISVLEGLPVIPVMFECASALGTVGLSTGITPGLSFPAKLILISYMFLGRVGGITIAYAMLRYSATVTARMPAEKVAVG